jgi:diacylglycerol kinase (ATP)
MHAVLILNPVSGASMLASEEGEGEQYEERIVTALRKQGIEVEVRYTTPEDPGRGLAQQAAEEGVDIIIAAGGDGTIHAVAAGLLGTKGTLGIIPVGTMNNIARSLAIPEDIEEACKIIVGGKTRPIDVGKINDQVFLEVAGVGLEAALFPAAEEIKSKGWSSTLHGIFAGLAKLFAFQPTRFRIAFDERRSRSYNAIQVSICNTPYYGAHFSFAPDAVMDDGFLDVLIYKNFSKIEYLRHAFSISQGRRPFVPKIMHRKVKSLRIHAETPVEMHADGVSQGVTPATITVVPGALNAFVSEKVAAGRNVSSGKRKRTQRYARSQSQDLFKDGELTKKEDHVEEKGPLYAQKEA